MNRNIRINIGEQRFYKLREENSLYIDKTEFIREWWETGATSTLITRPRRFGKTLKMVRKRIGKNTISCKEHIRLNTALPSRGRSA